MFLVCICSVGCTSLLGIDGDYDDGPTLPSQDASTGGVSADAGSDAGDATGGVGGSGAGSDGGPGTEDCSNGLDDDGDDAIDCADPKCQAQGYTCVAAAPSGWSGPFAYWVGTPSHAPCPSAYPASVFKGWSDLTAPASDCSCSCVKAGDDCEAQVGWWPWKSPPTCGSTPTGNWYSGVNCNVADGGNFKLFGFRSTAQCTPKVSNKMTPPATWKTGKQLCEASNLGACVAKDQVCAPPIPTPFASKNCVAKLGAHSCPSPYLTAHQLYQDVADSRDCTCSCNLAHGSCSAEVALPVNSCFQSFPLKPKVGECHLTASSSAKVSIKVQKDSITTSASCTPAKQQTGSATPSELVTVCCL